MIDLAVGAEHTVVATSIRWNVPLPSTLASRVRELLAGICRDLLDPDEMDSVAMAAHELLENVVKYSSDGTSSFEVEIGERDGGALVRLRTRNSAAPENRDGLERLLKRLGEAADPLAVYDELVASSPRRTGSGLGLARIRAEAEMSVTLVAEGRLVTIVAERAVVLRGLS
jgi:hypothetical protein